MRTVNLRMHHFSMDPFKCAPYLKVGGCDIGENEAGDGIGYGASESGSTTMQTNRETQQCEPIRKYAVLWPNLIQADKRD